MKPSKLILAAVLCVLFYIPSPSQCVDVLTLDTPKPQPQTQDAINRADSEIRRVAVKPRGTVTLTETQIKERNAQWADYDMLASKAAPPASEVLEVTLPLDTRLKLVIDNDVDSNLNRTEDYVPFSVAEAVYAKNADGTKRCVVIPKDTKVYGIVDYVKTRSPFRLKGRARLYVYVDTISLPEEKAVAITFARPKGVVDAYGTRKRKDKVVVDCEIDRGKKCIVGRRAKVNFAPTILGAGVGHLYAFRGDDVSNTAAALDLISSVANASGLTDIVNQPHAGLKQKQVFEASTTAEVKILVSTKKAEAKEPDKPKP